MKHIPVDTCRAAAFYGEGMLHSEVDTCDTAISYNPITSSIMAA